MAWNGVPAKDDDDLTIQGYYVRLNALRSFLSPIAAQMFDIGWEKASSREMREFHRSALVGTVLADLIRALALDEVTEAVIPVGAWFVHSGETIYSPYRDGRATARIELPGGETLQSIVRASCAVTSSAAVNMRGTDDVSFVVGRRTAPDRFDLVSAGYREASENLRSHRAGPSTKAEHILVRGWSETYLRRILPRVEMDLPDEVTLALAIKDTAERFSIAVHNQGAWRMLYGDDGQPAHETRHQNLFRLFSQLTFGGLGIGVHPRSDHGRGATDLTLTLGAAVNVVEFKKDTSVTELLHGLEVQLPLYMESAGTACGTYITLCHNRTPREVRRLVKSKSRDAISIEIFVVDCRSQAPASKA